MEKTSILEFINKLTEKKQDALTDEQNAASETTISRPQQADDRSLFEKNTQSVMKSYNPFSAAEYTKSQISSQKTQVKPLKTTIDLKSGKNLVNEKNKDVSRDMIKFINKHNALSKKIK